MTENEALELDKLIADAREISEAKDGLAKVYRGFKDYGNPKSTITSGAEKAQKEAEQYESVAKLFEELKQYRAIGTVEEIQTYRDAEEQGLLLKLPCKVGETVWFVGNEFVNDYEVRNFIVDETGVDCIQIAKEIDGRDYWNSFSIYDFNKTVFLTKEEAEQALKQMGE